MCVEYERQLLQLTQVLDVVTQYSGNKHLHVTLDNLHVFSGWQKNSLPSVILGEVGRTRAVEQEHLPKFA
ncbi:hypothetical protein EMCRGX_G002985 [Ephydatia muelleri]